MTALLLIVSAAWAQDGAKVFQQSCAVGYCHGTAGSANRAPRLAGRDFDRTYLLRVVEKGVPNTAMPGFQGKVKDEDLRAVVEYVLTLGGGARPVAAAPVAAAGQAAPKNLPGKELFFDPVRGTRCGTCHLVEGMGTAAGPNLAAKPDITAGDIERARSPHVETATFAGDRFPALVVSRKDGWVKLYDLTVAPPVLRTLPEGSVTFGPGTWAHGQAAGSYRSGELEKIAEYLRSLAKQ